MEVKAVGGVEDLHGIAVNRHPELVADLLEHERVGRSGAGNLNPSVIVEDCARCLAGGDGRVAGLESVTKKSLPGSACVLPRTETGIAFLGGLPGGEYDVPLDGLEVVSFGWAVPVRVA